LVTLIEILRADWQSSNSVYPDWMELLNLHIDRLVMF